jgi:transposase
MKQRQVFSKEFKLEAVRLLESSDRPAAEIARQLGIRRNQLYKWQQELRRRGNGAFCRARPASNAGR